MNKLSNILVLILAIIGVLLILGLVAVEIYVWITYANTPINELPSWVVFLMFGSK